ncbi:MAG: N-acetyltransferase, partial [Pseudomonadota bacterium]
HAVFSHLPVRLDGRAVSSLALGPISVRADYRNKGVGKLLIRTGLDAAAERGTKAIFVLGDPAYYGRFGFNAHLAAHLNAPFEEDGFMALELVDGALDGDRGLVTYPDAWGLNNPGSISL